MIIPQGSIENRNAIAIRFRLYERPSPMPKTMDRDTPSSAPLEIPVVNGSASGLRIMVCIIAPPTLSMAPMVTHPIALGM